MFDFINQEKKEKVTREANQTITACNALADVLSVFNDFDGKVYNKRFADALAARMEGSGYRATISKSGHDARELEMSIYKSSFYSMAEKFYISSTGYGVNHGEQCKPLDESGRIVAANAITIINQAIAHKTEYASEIINTDFDKLNNDIIELAQAYNKVKGGYNYTLLCGLGLYPGGHHGASDTAELQHAYYLMERNK